MANGWIPFYVADYLADTSDLSLAEHGAYILLMAHYYQTRKPLDAHASVLHRICRCETDADRAAVARVIEKFFVFQVDSYHNNRIDRELVKSSEIRAKRSKAAVLRWKVDDANAYANASDVHIHVDTQSQSQSQVKPKTYSEIPEWVPREAWESFVEMRKKIKAPLTGKAVSLAIGQLDKFRQSGQDPGAILEQSVMRSWRGLFPVANPAGAGNGTGTSKAAERKSRIQAANRVAFREIVGEPFDDGGGVPPGDGAGTEGEMGEVVEILPNRDG